MAEQFGDKTEAPSQKRKDDAFKDGDILRSREFATALVVLAGCGWLSLFGPSLMAACKALMTESFQFGRADVENFAPMRPLAAAGWRLAPSLGALAIVSVAAAVLSQGGLGSISFNGGLLQPKFQRINPASGMKRIFGLNGWTELGKSLLKVALLGSIGAYMLWWAGKQSIGLAAGDVDGAVGSLGSMLSGILFAMALGLVIIAGIDVPIQLFQRFRRLRMTKQEVKDERKEADGNPEVKAQIRQRQQAMARRNVKKAVESAHVVLTNPTHFAVALRYDRGTDQVPVVVAKGRGVTALAIREVAAENKVPTLEYPMLARALYYTTRENQEIRDDLYMPIATVLAFVFGLNARAGGKQPDVPVPPTARFDENGVKIAENA
ncbi:EscU/YscU/HrcU family type III secretion system export apparatus switch protein [Sphingomonas sp. GlSt437]|uniref:EscU/YscU/HrcU family type III secretion system export apparatus switch protein n=1 Tax=Sphingomonas sp. GlSt437 TaxID=3389970 RepID=UPI003A85F4E5